LSSNSSSGSNRARRGFNSVTNRVAQLLTQLINRIRRGLGTGLRNLLDNDALRTRLVKFIHRGTRIRLNITPQQKEVDVRILVNPGN